MAFTQVTETSIASLTNVGRSLYANQPLGLVGFSISGFKVGRGGYNNGAPYSVTALNLAATALDDTIFPIPTSNTQPISQFESPYPNVIGCVCRIDRSAATYCLGEIGLFATITFSNTGLFVVGDVHMIALSHFALKAKSDKDVFITRLLVVT